MRRPHLPSTIGAVVAGVAAGLALAACGSSATTTSSAPTSSAGATTLSATKVSPTTASTGSSASSGGAVGACGKYTDGKDGVIRTFCDGSATATITLAGKTTTIHGGTCEPSGGYFTVNAGVVTGTGFTGTKPDYLGVLLPPAGGAFTHVGFTGSASGTTIFAAASGTVSSDLKTVSASGTNSLGTPGPITIKIDC
jgi:hypothetical protein